MEQARYWMWAKRKHNTTLSTSHDHHHHLQVPISNNPSNNDDSWEEQAFAEDAAGPLGGCIWPPRSYSCSFCRREFRSAQALGGHMNVHRRDRARLKQSSPNEHNSESTHQIPQAHHSVQNHLFSSLGFHQYPSSHHHHPVCALVYNPNNPTTPDHHHPGTTTTTTTTTNITSSSPASPSRVSAQFPCKENCGGDQQTLIPPYSSSPQSRSILATNRYYNEGEKISIINVESGSRSKGSDHHDHVASSTTDHFSVSLNLVVRSCVRPPVSGGDHQDEEISCKRRRLTDNNDECPSSSIPFFIKSGSVDRVHHHLQSSEGFELGRPSSIEDLDLELRLGDRPKVK